MNADASQGEGGGCSDSRKAAPGLTRRRFVEGVAGAAAMFAVGGAGYAFAGTEDVLRPPGGQDADRLFASCIRCDRCRSACPHQAISLLHVEDGLVSARMPKMNFHRGYCDFCEADGYRYRCVDACPTQAIAFGFDRFSDKIGVAKLDEDECVLLRGGSGKCSKQCIAACKYDALSLDGSRIVVDEQKCNGCGACEHDCPSASYASYTGSGKRGINIEVWEAVC